MFAYNKITLYTLENICIDLKYVTVTLKNKRVNVIFVYFSKSYNTEISKILNLNYLIKIKEEILNN